MASFAHVSGEIECVESVTVFEMTSFDTVSRVGVQNSYPFEQGHVGLEVLIALKVWSERLAGNRLRADAERQIVEIEVLEIEGIFFDGAIEGSIFDESYNDPPGQLSRHHVVFVE